MFAEDKIVTLKSTDNKDGFVNKRKCSANLDV